MARTNTDAGREKLLTSAEVGAWVGISPAGMSQMRYRGDGPKYRKLSERTVRYVESDVQAWIDASERNGTADAS